MQSKRRKPSGSMDGFVPRNRVNTPRRASLDSRPQRRRSSDGFVPRSSPASEPLQLKKDDEWADENTLTISNAGNDALKGVRTRKGTLKGGSGDPKWWEFGTKRRMKKGKPELSHKQKVFRRILLVIAAIFILIGAYLGFAVLRNAAKVFDGNVLGFFSTTKLKGEEQGRVNILLAGTSEDEPGHGGADLTDSIMLISIDTENNEAFTVSIPRDLWVRYAGEQCFTGFAGKINAAYQCGNTTNFTEAGYADGGMGLLSKIVSQNFGVPIHYYGKLNYTAFRDAVSAVGGIEVTIDSDDPRGVFDPNISPRDGGPLRLQNGPQKLDGITALALARSRNSAGGYGMSRGDFDRTSYQQAMLVALKDKALSTGVVANPAKLTNLLNAAGDNVDTSFQPNEVRRLYELSQLITNENITSIDLASDEINLITTGMFSGQSIVRPIAGIDNFTQIKAYFKKLTSNNPVTKEDSQVVVLNGSGAAGLAQTKADQLAVQGISILAVANANNRQNTVIVDLTKGAKNNTKSLLESKFGVTATTNTTAVPEASNYNADFVIILGRNVRN